MSARETVVSYGGMAEAEISLENGIITSVISLKWIVVPIE